MLKIERQKYILDSLKESEFIKVEDLALSLGVAPMTIRRDLDNLELEGRLQRVHGGATLSSWIIREDDYLTKSQKNIEIKNKIAQKALKYIKDEMTIYLDAGTTCFELAKLLLNKHGLTIITSDVKIAALLYDTDNYIYIFGGNIEKSTGMVFPLMDSLLDNININYAFMGASTLTNNLNITTPTFEKARFKQKVLKSSRRKVLLFDKSKFGLSSFVKICGLVDFDIFISDVELDENQKNLLEKNDVMFEIVKQT